MKPKMTFRVICAFLGFLLLFMVISLIVINGNKDEALEVNELLLIFGVSTYFLYYAFWQGRNRIPETVKKAESGDLESQLQLALHYSWSEKSEPNFEEAFKWYIMAAEQGDAGALHNLGCMYLTGNGVEESPKKAFKLFYKSAETGFKNAQHSVGQMLYEGVGTQTNRGEAIKWLRLAAQQGHKEAEAILNNILKEEGQL